MKSQTTDCKKIFARHVKKLLPRIYEKLLQLSNKEIAQLFLKEQTFWTIHQGYQVANEPMKRCSTSSHDRETRSKTTMRYN